MLGDASHRGRANEGARGSPHAHRPHVVPAGSGFVDNGGDVHLVRNESTVEAVVT
jgi:hypothetical protein